MDLDPLIDRFRGPLVGLLASWGASPRDAHELAQDTFCQAYLSRERFEGDWTDPGAAGAWLRGIASRLWLSHGRRTRRPDAVVQRELAPRLEESLGERDEESDEAARLRVLIGALPGELRTILHLRYVEDSGLAEIAGLMGLTERAVEGRLHRARKELKDRLEAAGAVASQAAQSQAKEDRE